MEQAVFSRAFAKRLAYLAAAAAVFGCVLSAVLAHAAEDTAAPAWAAPETMALRRVSQVTGSQSEPVFLNNIDCAPLTYRLPASHVMQTGCFTGTAFGLLDSDSGTGIFNGTDEGLPLLPHTPHQILVPWPKAMDLVGLDPVATGGTIVSLYTNPLAALQDQRNFLGQLTTKRLDRPPDITLKDSLGRPLVINPQTLAFSAGGAWMVAETLSGSFTRVNLAALDMKAFAPAYGSQGSPALLKSQVSITEDGRFAAIANDVAAAFKVYDLSGCAAVCRSYDYWPFLRQQVSGLRSVQHVRFIGDNLLSFDVLSGDPSQSGTYELAPAGSIDALTGYIGLGDSYTSGEGAFDYLDGTDTPNNLCHLSRQSYPLLLAHDLFGGTGGHSVACSGAVIRDVGDTGGGYRGQVKGGVSLDQLRQSQPLLLETVESHFIPGYVAQQRFISRWQPRIATVSIGGNDIGFGHILQNCVMPHISLRANANSCYNTYEDRQELSRLIDRTVPRWTALYKQLQRQAPGSRLYAVGYPQVALAGGNCALNVHLDRQELELAAGVIDYLNQSIREAAGAAGVTYIDISQALAGHRLCETASYNVAVNGLTAGNDAGIFKTGPIGKESYHPNALGHRLIEQAILEQTANFAAPAESLAAPAAQGGAGVKSLPDAPVSGRPLTALIPKDNLTDSVARRGGTLAVNIDGAESGLRPGTIYSVRLDSAAGSVLGNMTSGSDGDVSGQVVLPEQTPPGGHSVVVTGPGQTDETVAVSQPVYVPAGDADSDGDGIDDMVDSCPGAINSGRDDDRDGTDDTCDALIGPPPAAGAGTNSRASGAATANSHPGDTGGSGGDVHCTSYMRPLAEGLCSRAVLAAAGPKSVRSARLNPGKWLPGPTGRLPGWLLWGGFLLTAAAVIAAGKRYIKKITFRLQWVHMNRVRKGFIYLLSLFLLATLLGTAVATSTNNTLGKPEKVETYLDRSRLYDHFIEYTTDQAKKSNGDTDQSDSVSLSDAAIKAAAEESFTQALIKQNINKVIEANYAWLEGKTATPQFSVDLAAQKQTFAEKVGQYVTTYSAGLPVCTDPSVAAQQTRDPLAATCRPAELSPEAAGAQVTQNLATTGDFLSDPTVTPNNINPEKNPTSQPYYEKLSQLPKAYQFGTKLPYIFAGLSLLAALGIIFLSSPRRKGIRRVGIVLLIAGLGLVALKFLSDYAFRRAEHRIFNNANVGQLQQSLTDFLHRIEMSMVRTELWFGIGFLLLAAVIFGTLAATRQKEAGSGTDGDTPAGKPQDPDDDSAPLLISRKRLQRRPVNDLTPRARPKETTPAAQPQPKKPRRLIQ
jgi:hypothetical protein